MTCWLSGERSLSFGLLVWITSDFSINFMYFTSELQTVITFLFVDENIKCGYASSKLENDENLVPIIRVLKNCFCIFSTSFFSGLGIARSLCYVTSSNFYDVTCLTL